MVTINLYDVIGSKIKIIMEQNVNPGAHRINFERQGLQSGAYLVEMVTSNNRFSKRLILN